MLKLREGRCKHVKVNMAVTKKLLLVKQLKLINWIMKIQKSWIYFVMLNYLNYVNLH